MIAKNKKGKSFGGCVRYVLNQGHEILESEGVLALDEASIIRDFAVQRSGRPEIKQPVGHIPISFCAEDTPRLTNDFMLKLAHEYMQEMGIENTQYIVVRHNDTAHPHMHIVYNRIDNDLKVISVNNDYKRNIKTCKKLKDRYSLTYGKIGKDKVNRPKLQGEDKVRYEIHDNIKAILPKCQSFDELQKRLKQGGISIKYKYRSGEEESEENIQGLSFNKSGYSFKASGIDRKFSYANLKKALDKNLNRKAEALIEEEAVAARIVNRNPVIFGIALTDEQYKTLREGGHLYLENMVSKEGTGKFSAFVFLDDKREQVFTSNENPDAMVEYEDVTVRVRDKIQVEKGYMVKAKMKWWGGSDYQHPFLWKDPKTNKIEYSFADPRIPKEKKVTQRDARRNKTPQKKKGPSVG